jgi:hypothetical protein
MLASATIISTTGADLRAVAQHLVDAADGQHAVDEDADEEAVEHRDHRRLVGVKAPDRRPAQDDDRVPAGPRSPP